MQAAKDKVTKQEDDIFNAERAVTAAQVRQRGRSLDSTENVAVAHGLQRRWSTDL